MEGTGGGAMTSVILLDDTFHNYFDPSPLAAAARVAHRGGGQGDVDLGAVRGIAESGVHRDAARLAERYDQQNPMPYQWDGQAVLAETYQKDRSGALSRQEQVIRTMLPSKDTMPLTAW